MDFHYLVDNIWPLTVGGLVAGSIYVLVALGYTLVYGVLRLINFAHSEIFMLGTFGALWASYWLGIGVLDAPKSGLVLVGTIAFAGLIAMAVSGTSAVLLERIAYRPLRRRGATRLAALISAIGASFAISEGVGLIVDRAPRAYPRVLSRFKVFSLFGTEVRNDQLLIVISAAVMMVLLDQFIRRSRLGRGIRAVAQDAESARLMGVDIDRVIMVTFLLGGIMAGWAGMLNITFYESTKFDVGFLLGVKAFTAAVLGGIGNLRGALLGGLLLGLIENYGSGIFGGQWKDVVAFTLLVVVLLVRPAGILGESLGRARA